LLLGLLSAEPQTEAPAVRVVPTPGLKMESVALLMSGQQGGSIHVAALPLFLPGQNGRVRVPVVLEIDGATLLQGTTGDRLRVEICLYAVSKKAGGNAEGRVEGSLLETVDADLTRAGSAVARSGLQYTGELSLVPGETSLRVLVRNAQTGEVGLRFLPITVPDFGSSPLLLAPEFSNPSFDAWVSTRTPTAAQPVLGTDQEARFEVPVWKLKPDALRVEILRPDGGHAADFPAKIESRREAGGLERVTASFVPTGLEQGRYQIRALVPGVSGVSGISAWPSPFVLLAGGSEGKVWAELMHGGQSAPRQASPPEPRARRRKLDAGPIRDGYRKALQLLADGEETAARRALSALETPLFAGANPATPEDVAEIEMDLVKGLDAARPQSLLPVALLHQSLYSDAFQKRDFLRAAHTREMIFALAGLAAQPGNEAGRTTAVRLLLGLASRLAESSSEGLRDRIFQQVLAFDKNEPAALLYLAAKAEHDGRYPEAASRLQELLSQHPDGPDTAEARLRLAVNLRRLGKPADADRLLDSLRQAGAEPTWVITLACQETGRALLAAGRLDDAERSLHTALERLPGDEKLLLELASAFDQRNDPAQARQILAGFHPVQDSTESARHRYNRLPTEALDRAWNELVRSAPEGLPALAEALQAMRKGG
jgi:tetratricopeptide (TPR) repeat protein